VKHLKVDLLPLLANHVNARDIANELSEYITDVDSELSKRCDDDLNDDDDNDDDGSYDAWLSFYSSTMSLIFTIMIYHVYR